MNRHIEMVYTVIPAGNERTVLLDKVNELLSELKDIFQGIYLIKDLSSKTSATIVSYGERLSSIIVASLIKGAVWYDSRNFIKTEKKHAKHILDSELTTRLVKETFRIFRSVAKNGRALRNVALQKRQDFIFSRRKQVDPFAVYSFGQTL